MIDNSSEINPTKVLIQLREGRPKLVEDTVQFNFALEVFEDVVFGEKSTVIIEENIPPNFEQLLNNSSLEFSQLQNIPIHTTYDYNKTLNLPDVRNMQALPPDGRRVYFENKDLEVCNLFFIINWFLFGYKDVKKRIL